MIEHILLIDDEPDIRAVATVSLAHIGGWRVSQAGSADEGLRMAREDRPDLVLLDVMMPGTDGPATLARMRQDPALSDIPVLFLTAKASPQDIEQLVALGALAVLVKPFDPMTLPQQIRDAVGGGS